MKIPSSSDQIAVKASMLISLAAATASFLAEKFLFSFGGDSEQLTFALLPHESGRENIKT